MTDSQLENTKLVYDDNMLDHISKHRVILELAEINDMQLMKAFDTSENNQKMINMKKYTAKDEEDLIEQIESDTELDKELKQEKLVKGHIVEIRYAGNAHKKSRITKKKLLTGEA